MKFLVAMDGSKPALRALKCAMNMVQSLRPGPHSITLISVHDDVGLRHAKAFVGSDAVADYLRTVSEKDLKSAKKMLDQAGIPHDMVIKTGHVAQEITKLAKSGRFDFIAVGNKGHSALADALLGSVAQRVVATAERPVMVVR